MNIIITNDKSVRLTQYDATDSTPIDIQNIYVHAVPELTPTHLSLVYKEVVEGDDIELYPEQAGNTYYYDPKTGLMAKGYVQIGGQYYYFDETTGVLQ